MDFKELDLQRYTESHSDPEPEVLHRIARNTRQQSAYPQMLSGHIQGRLLAMMSRMITPNRILEIGTFTAYGTICLAEGLSANGQIDTIEKDPELEAQIKTNLAEAGLENQCTLHLGNAMTILPSLNLSYDLIFIDADKVNYPFYLEQALRLSKPGTWILADNVLWGGKVIDPKQKDTDTLAIRNFNSMVKEHPQLSKVMLPIRDGISVMQVVSAK